MQIQRITKKINGGALCVLIRHLLQSLFCQCCPNVIPFSNFVRKCIIRINKTVIILTFSVYLLILGSKVCLKAHVHCNGCRFSSAKIMYSPTSNLLLWENKSRIMRGLQECIPHIKSECTASRD